MQTEQSRPYGMEDDGNDARDKRECGEPGGGQGRRDEVGPTGVYNLHADFIPPDAEIRMAGSWGGGDYNESGGSELVYRDGVLLGGLTAGPDGEPTIDIHDGRPRPPDGPLESSDAEAGDDASGGVVDRDALRLRALSPGEEGDSNDSDQPSMT